MAVEILHPLCRHCAKIIAPDEPRWTAREPEEHWHYACAETAKLTTGDQFRAIVAARTKSA